MNRPSASDQNLAKAIQLHQSGNLDRAIRLYEKVVQGQPRHAAALNLLGIACFQAGRAEDAVSPMERALAIKADLPDTRYNLGLILHSLRRFEDAIPHLQQSVAERPADAEAHNNLGAALKEAGRYEAAVEQYRAALALNPGYAEARSNLGNALLALGHAPEAMEQFRQALALRPDAIEALVNLASALLAAGDASEAFALVRRALAAGGDTPEIKRLFVACISGELTYTPGDDLRSVLIRAMTEPWSRPERLMLLADTVVRTNPRVDAAIERAESAWPHMAGTEHLQADELAAASAEPLLICMLTSAPVRTIALERFVTAARFALLANAANATASDDADPDLLRFWCAVAQQSFINGYVHAHTEDEFALAQQLRDRLIAAAEARAPVPSLWVAAVGAYFPLHTSGIAPALLRHTFPDAVDALLTQQVREPEQEDGFRAAIPLVTEIDDSVSLAVQQQYEEMPSPRWVRLAPAFQPMTFGEYVQLHLPAAGIDGFPKTGKFDALVAGCGTGREPIEFAQFVPDARILAVDLSLASLAYAKRKSAEFGIKNIEFGRGDILKLGTLDRQFDYITAMGSLQCLADPMQGWRILLSRLRPGGLMTVRIYSETGRSETVAVQKALAGRGFTGTAEDIRRARQEILACTDETPYKKLSAASELSNLGECRDLLFHVNESRTTLPALRRFIELNELDFLGFRTSADVARAYASRFADDAQMTSLEHWNSFERDNPNSSPGSYEFWVQKRNTRH